MASTLPTPVSLVPKVDGVDRYLAAHINTLQDEVQAIERGQHSSQTVTEAVLVSGIDFALGETVYVTLTANRVMGAILNPIANQRGKVVFINGASWTVTLPASVSAPGFSLNNGANAITELPVEYSASLSKWIFASNPPSSLNGKAIEQGGAYFSPIAYNCKFDGVTLDDAGWLALIAAVTPTRGAPTTVVTALGEIRLPGGVSIVSADTVAFRNLLGLSLQGAAPFATEIRINTAGTNGLDLNGCAHGKVGGFLLNPGSAGVTNAINWHQGDYPSGRSCTAMSFRDIGITNGVFIHGWAVGNDNAGSAPQVDSGRWDRCRVVGAYVAGPNYIHGWYFGNGTAGNNYDHLLTNCDTSTCQYHVESNKSGFWQKGGQPQGNQVTFQITQALRPITIESIESQNDVRFLFVTGGTTTTMVSLRDIDYDASSMNADGQFIQLNALFTLQIDGLRVHNVGALTPVIQAQGNPYRSVITTRGCQIPTTAVSAFVVDASGFTIIVHQGYMQATSGDLFSDYTALWTNQLPTLRVVTKSAPYTVTLTDCVVLVTGTTTITLPGAAPIGRQYIVKNKGTNTVTVTPASGTIEGAASQSLTPNASVQAISDGTNYVVI